MMHDGPKQNPMPKLSWTFRFLWRLFRLSSWSNCLRYRRPSKRISWHRISLGPALHSHDYRTSSSRLEYSATGKSITLQQKSATNETSSVTYILLDKRNPNNWVQLLGATLVMPVKVTWLSLFQGGYVITQDSTRWRFGSPGLRLFSAFFYFSSFVMWIKWVFGVME